MNGQQHHQSEDTSRRSSGPAVRVLAAVIRRDDRYLVCRRPPHKRHGGLWEFPGGKIHEGETLLDAASRELAEELSLRALAVGAVLFARGDAGSQFVIEFADVDADGEPIALEHDEVRWLTRDEILRLELAPADRRFAEEALLP